MTYISSQLQLMQKRNADDTAEMNNPDFQPQDANIPDGGYVSNQPSASNGLMGSSTSPSNGAQLTPPVPSPGGALSSSLGSGDPNSLPGGIDKSWVEGYLARKQLGFDEDKNTRENSTQSIAEENQSFKRNEYQRMVNIRDGMSQAAQDGGFSGVIDYLKNADPEKAIEFMKNKEDLDSSIMANDTYRTAHGNDKAQAMLEGYKLLGGLGATLMKVKDPAQRASIWENTLSPIAQTISPNISSKLDNNSMGQMMLGMSLSTPANILYDNTRQLGLYKSDLGKTMQDYQLAVNQYGKNSPQAKLLAHQAQGLSQASDRSTLTMANTLANDQANGEDKLRGQWLEQTKGFNTMAQAHANINNAVAASQTPDGKLKGPDDMSIIYNYFKMLAPDAAVRPGEYANAENTKGWSDSMREQYNHIKSGAKLSDGQRQAFADSAQMMYETKAQSYYSTKSQFQDIAKKNGYNPDNITVDSSEAYLPKPPDTHIQYLQQHATDPKVRQQFQLKYGQSQLNQYLPQVQPNGR